MFISELIDILIKYKKEYGDVPCFIADMLSPSAMESIHSAFVATISTNNTVSTLPYQNYGSVKMNVVVITNAHCDSEESTVEIKEGEEWGMK